MKIFSDGRHLASDFGTTKPSLVLVFAAREEMQDPAFFAALKRRHPTSVLAGCSTAGHFVGDLLSDDPVSIGIEFDDARLAQASVPLPSSGDSFGAGEKLGVELNQPDLKAVMVFSDGVDCNGSALVEGLTAALPRDTVIFGGLAADGDAFVETAVLDSTGVHSGIVSAVGFAGDRFEVRTGTGGGWDLFGPERTITGASDSTLMELDGEPALDLYKRYLDDRADELPGSALLFPLAIRHPDAPFDSHIVRTVLGVDEELNSMTFAGDMPVGWRAQMMRASFDALVDGASDSAEVAVDDWEPDGDALCLGITCVGRRLVLGSRTEDELEAVVDVVAGRGQLVGYYSYGELAPGFSGHCELHNQTMTLALFGER